MAELTVPLTVTEALARAVEAHPDRPALHSVPDDSSFTFRELGAAVEAAVEALFAAGLRPGGRIAVFLPNRAEYPILWLACAKLGAVLVPINAQFRSLDAAYVVERVDPAIVVVDTERLEVLRQVGVPSHVTVWNVDEPPLAPDVEALEGLDDLPPPFPGSVLNLLFTSGTTGRPKACEVTQRYWMTYADKNLNRVLHVRADDVMLSAQPFSYMDPMWNLATTIAAGASLVVLDRFHPSTFWKSVAEHGATLFYCIGTMPKLLVKMEPSEVERSHRVRGVICSGIPVDQHEELERRFGTRWMETYGMTETGNITAVTEGDHERLRGTGSVGRPLKYREIRIMTGDGRFAPVGTVGEVVVRGTGMMDGYLDDPAANAAAFNRGWFCTGDLGRMDEDGYLYLVGRAKDMIRRAGENVSAFEVEQAIELHPDVELVACVPVPDEIRGEEIKAYVVLKARWDDLDLQERELPEHCARLLAKFKVPRFWEYRPSLPVTQSNKVAKAALLSESDDLRTGAWDSVERTWR
jgi:crotonobetaine/carnitine-CoA ligase